MIFPISDDDRALVKPAYVTYALVVLNVLMFFYQQANPEFTYGWSVVPAEMTTGTDLVESTVIEAGGQRVEIPQLPGPQPIWLTVFSAMFMHGGWMHLLGNMLFLWIFGDNVEHRFGHLKFLFFYLISGIVATFAQVLVAPHSTIPNLGASGAISGVMGAYLVLFPRNRVYAVVFYHIMTVPAVVAIGMWGLLQFISGASSLSAAGQTGGVAYMAHIGGFVAGIVAGLLARVLLREEPDSMMRREYQRDDRARLYW